MFEILWLGQAEPIAESNTHVFGGLFPDTFWVFFQRENVGIAGAEQHFLQGADLVDNVVEEAFAGHTGFALDDEQFVRLDETNVKLVVVLDATVGNMSVSDDAELTMILTQKEIKSVEASIVTGAMADHNTFDDPEKVTEKAFKDYKTDGRKLSLTIPKNSVVLLRVK